MTTTFSGDRTRYNSEELLVGALSRCHMLWVLYLRADAGSVITGYSDEAIGEMVERADGPGEFTRAVLRPRLSITDAGRAADAIARRTLRHLSPYTFKQTLSSVNLAISAIISTACQGAVGPGGTFFWFRGIRTEHAPEPVVLVSIRSAGDYGIDDTNSSIRDSMGFENLQPSETRPLGPNRPQWFDGPAGGGR